ncbi:hypothetical protein KY336_01310, partial [Candidatus Woesearchaeota archaeon]|nr:hypothetical protein [Candidatus Woesearchaeota archaeon]
KEFKVNATCFSKIEGINKDTEPILQIGSITSGGTHTRYINISNDATYGINVRTNIEGEIKDYMTISAPKNANPNEIVKINLTVTCPEKPKGTEELNLQGVVTVSLYK